MSNSYFVDPNNATSTSRDFSLVAGTVLSNGSEATDLSAEFTADFFGNIIAIWSIGPAEAVSVGATIASSINSGVFSLSGDLAGSFVNFKSNIESGAFSLLGLTVSSYTDLVSQIYSGSFLLTGNAIGDLLHRLSKIESGPFTIIGSATDTIYTSALSSLIESGSFIITGSTINEIYNRVSQISSVDFSLTGLDIGTFAYFEDGSLFRIESNTVLNTLKLSSAIGYLSIISTVKQESIAAKQSIAILYDGE